MDLSEVVDISWAQFDQYVAATQAVAPAPAARVPRGEDTAGVAPPGAVCAIM